MAETSSLPSTDRVSAESTYRPLAILAVIGLAVGVLFAVLVVANVVAGLTRGVPPFSLGSGFLLVPLVGTALTLVAMGQIRRSEGTRAGMALAGWGLGLNLVFGLGYGVADFATALAVRQQAEKFLVDPATGFVARLKQPDGVNLAFLMTQLPEYRGDLSSSRNNDEIEARFDKWDSGQPSRLAHFRNHYIVRLLHQANARGERTAEVKVRGVRSEFREGYWVSVLLEIQNEEFTALAPLIVRTKDTGTGEREWFVDSNQLPGRPKELVLSPHGQEMYLLREHSHKLAEAWIRHRFMGLPENPPVVAASTASLVSSALGKGPLLAVAGLVPSKTPITWDRVRGEKSRKEARTIVRHLLLSTADEPQRPSEFHFLCCTVSSESLMPPMAYWELDRTTGRLRFTHELVMPVMDESSRRPKIVCPAQIIVERIDKTGPEALKFDRDHPPVWRIVRMDVLQVHHVTAMVQRQQ
jgi:hypothetical protein